MEQPNSTDVALSSLLVIDKQERAKDLAPVQSKLFAEPKSASKAMQFDGTVKHKPSSKKKPETDGYGMGERELTRFYIPDLSWSYLSDKKKLGVIAHQSHNRIFATIRAVFRSSYIKSIENGKTFLQWFQEHGIQSYYKRLLSQWNITYGWVDGWWNTTPEGKRPAKPDLTDAQIIEQWIHTRKAVA